jgi:hypothetical protein
MQRPPGYVRQRSEPGVDSSQTLVAGTDRALALPFQVIEKVLVPMESLVGRRLSELLTDPEPLVSRQFLHMLLQPS